MSAIEQVFTIGIVKDEHPRLHAEALAELAQLRAALSAAQQRAETAERERDAAHIYLDESFVNSPDDESNLELADRIALVVEELYVTRKERDEARAQLREIDELIAPLDGQTLLEAVSYLIHDDGEPLTPRRCVTCARDAAREMREACESEARVRELDLVPRGNDRRWKVANEIADAIRALPLPAECADCNPLKPEVNRHGCNCPCGCDAQATKQDDHGVWWCESCYRDYMGISPVTKDEATR